MVNLAVPFVPQSGENDCWLAALKMLVKFRDGTAEPVGHPKAKAEGDEAQRRRAVIRSDAENARKARVEARTKRDSATGGKPTKEQADQDGMEDLGHTQTVRKQLQQCPPRGLTADEFKDLAALNGLVPPTREPAAVKAGWTSAELESLLLKNGPLWCAFNYLHVVVVKGVTDDGRPIVHDPQGKADTAYQLDAFNKLLTQHPYGVMYLPTAT